MKSRDAAASMRATAARLEAWARACEVLELPDAQLFARPMLREAARLRADADALCPEQPKQQHHTNPPAMPATESSK